MEQWQQYEQILQDWKPEQEPPLQPSAASIIEEILSSLLYHDLDKGMLVEETALYEQLTRLGRLALWLKARDRESTTVSKAKEILGPNVYEYGRQLTVLRTRKNLVGFDTPLLFDYLAVYRLKELLESDNGTSRTTWERCGQMLASLLSDVLPLLIDGYVRSQSDIVSLAIA
ncbi:MAG TPA: hypothetical protein EYP10_09365 [Armatimonadetes bacterium]|nr:hypothetical protein [Armatimonadota bacterium]